MQRRALAVFTLALSIAVGATLHAQGELDAGKCAYPNGSDGNFGDCPGCTYGSWVKQRANENVFHRCIENPSTSKRWMWTDWKGILSSSRIPTGHRLYSFTTMAEQTVPGNTTLYYDDDRKETPAQAKCWKGEKACKTSSLRRLNSLFSWPPFAGTSAGKDKESSEKNALESRGTSIEAAIDERRAAVNAYREFFVPLTSKDDLVKFALQIQSRQVENDIAYSTSVYASKAVLGRTLSANDVVFRFSSRAPFETGPLQLQEQSLRFGLLSNAARSGSGIRLTDNSRFRADRVRLAEVVVDVHDRLGEKIATFTAPLLEKY